MADYPPPVNALLRYGEPRSVNRWPDYVRQLGLSREHVPDLVRMATDEALFNFEAHEDADFDAAWAPTHAWRALGQLGDPSVAEPLLEFIAKLDERDDDWGLEDGSHVFQLLGPGAIPALAVALADGSRSTFYRVVASESLRLIAEAHPEARERCVALLTTQLEGFVRNDPELNGFLISDLTLLKAVEAAPLIEGAFAADRVDAWAGGDWATVQVELGLLPPPDRPPSPPATGPTGPDHRRVQAERRSRRKLVKKARKGNRKRH